MQRIMQKKQISMLTAAMCVVGCAGLMAMPAVAAPASNADYTVTDLVNLQRSLLHLPTSESLENKPYDCNQDGVWDVRDLCLMKQEVFSSVTTSSDTLVVYFSRTNHTENIANRIVDDIGADRYEIEAAVPYTDDDIDYRQSSCRANQEQKDKTCRPEIADPLDSLDAYDVIYLGYPIWWGEEPRIVDTFLESYDFTGKTVIPFCTSASSGISTSETNIKNLLPNSKVLSGKRFSASASASEVQAWIDSLPITDSHTEQKLYLTINGTKLSATLEDNSSVQALKEKLSEGDVVIDAHDYSNFEKVGSLGFSLPRNDTQITTTPGDLILYQGNQFVFYYDENSWNFTKLGHVDNLTQEQLKQLLGDGNVTITLSLQ